MNDSRLFFFFFARIANNQDQQTNRAQDITRCVKIEGKKLPFACTLRANLHPF